MERILENLRKSVVKPISRLRKHSLTLVSSRPKGIRRKRQEKNATISTQKENRPQSPQRVTITKSAGDKSYADMVK